MQDLINRLRAKKGDEGFTLIELLVVVVIIGVLVAIAVPVYLNYREGAADKSAQSDVRGAVTAIEQFYTDNGNKYPASFAAPTADGTSSVTIGTGTQTTGTITLSNKTKMNYIQVVPASGSTTYLVCATNSGGSGKVYLYDSSKGGSVTAPSGTEAIKIETCKK